MTTHSLREAGRKVLNLLRLKRRSFQLKMVGFYVDRSDEPAKLGQTGAEILISAHQVPEGPPNLIIKEDGTIKEKS